MEIVKNGGLSGPWNVQFSPMIDVSACAKGPLKWISQNVSADNNGNYSDIWAPNEPNTLQVDGRVTAEVFAASLKCANSGPALGTITANKTGNGYQGVYDFLNFRGNVSIARANFNSHDNPGR